jgi:hypothetical protein
MGRYEFPSEPEQHAFIFNLGLFPVLTSPVTLMLGISDALNLENLGTFWTSLKNHGRGW